MSAADHVANAQHNNMRLKLAMFVRNPLQIRKIGLGEIAWDAWDNLQVFAMNFDCLKS